MNRASKSLWTYTLSTVEDLPSCPDDLSEPRYTHLIFSIYCHVCMAQSEVTDCNLLILVFVKDCLQTLSELVKGGEELLLYLEARTRLCRACSLKQCVLQTRISRWLQFLMTFVTMTRSFNHWNGLPEKVAPSLAGFVPATTNPLTNIEIKSRVYFGKKSKGMFTLTRWNAFRLTVALAFPDPQRVNDKRSRFCIDSALRLHSEYQTIIGTQAKRAWLNYSASSNIT